MKKIIFLLKGYGRYDGGYGSMMEGIEGFIIAMKFVVGLGVSVTQCP
jgi:hypothetical protein